MNISDKYNSNEMRIRVKTEVLRVIITNPISHWTKIFRAFFVLFLKI